MQWILKYGVAIVIVVALIGVGAGMAMWSSKMDKPLRTFVPTIGNNESVSNSDDHMPGAGTSVSDLISPLINAISAANATTPNVQHPTPATIPDNLTPWGTGPSDQDSPSTGGAAESGDGANVPPPPSVTPWGTGPSDQ